MIDLSRARACLGREAILLPDPVPVHPLLEGKKEISRGEYSIVLDKGDGERVKAFHLDQVQRVAR